MSDKMREEFEVAYTEVQVRLGIYSVKRLFDTLEGSYISSTTESAWWGWQASREAIEVELPQRWSVDGFESGWVADPDGANLDYAETVKAIEAAGLKVKPC